MKNLASLIRNSSSRTQRKKFGNVNMVRRKDQRRLKKINIYNKELTGQQNQNTWFSPKKIKAMGNHIETIRNNHVGTNQVQPALASQLLKIFPKLSDYQYWRSRNLQQQILQSRKTTQQCDIDFYISQLPAKLRNSMKNSEEESTPQIVEPLLKYIEQMQIFLPQDERYRYNLIQKIAHPSKSKLESDDQK